MLIVILYSIRGEGVNTLENEQDKYKILVIDNVNADLKLLETILKISDLPILLSSGCKNDIQFKTPYLNSFIFTQEDVGEVSNTQFIFCTFNDNLNYIKEALNIHNMECLL